MRVQLHDDQQHGADHRDGHAGPFQGVGQDWIGGEDPRKPRTAPARFARWENARTDTRSLQTPAATDRFDVGKDRSDRDERPR